MLIPSNIAQVALGYKMKCLETGTEYAWHDIFKPDYNEAEWDLSQ